MCKRKKHENIYKEDRTVCKSCYNEQKRKNDYNTLIRESKSDNVNNKIVFPEKQKHENKFNFSTFENHVCAIIGPGNVGKTYYLLKTLEKIGNKRSFDIKTRSLNQKPNYKTNNGMKSKDKYKRSVTIFLTIC